MRHRRCSQTCTGSVEQTCRSSDAASRFPPPRLRFVTEQPYKQRGDSETGPFSAGE